MTDYAMTQALTAALVTFVFFSVVLGDWTVPPMGARKVGGIWFVRFARLRFSFCVAREA